MYHLWVNVAQVQVQPVVTPVNSASINGHVLIGPWTQYWIAG